MNSNPNQISLVNNVAVDNQAYTMEDHAWFQYYVNTISQQGWNVEPELWKQLPDKVKSMVLNIRREGIKKSGISSPLKSASST